MSVAAGEEQLLPRLKRVLLELRDTRRQLEDLESRELEPVAIVGMACRFPGGANSPAELWELVAEGRDAIREFPAERGWDLDRLFDPDPSRPTTCYTRSGGFLADADLFDADLFAIAPREALAMDPQQRLLLEATWEAFEHAGIDPTGVKGENTGVYVGIGGSDYGRLVVRAPELDGFRVTGTVGSIASGRMAYTFGLEGPAVSVDTACSSSLVALHLACQALRRGECDQALAAGASFFSSPLLLVDFSRQRVLSPDGRCKAYGAAADGAGFSDGVGVVVLERLSRAHAKRHRVLAVIRGSAVNQDGASNGLIAPNGPSQVRVIRDALANAGVSPADVDAVEGHGTGTALGDPIEIQALLDTYGRERANGPLWLGSVKSNIGHCAAGAGVAGVIKMVQALRHERLPRSLHCDEPSPHVDWSAGGVRLLREPVPWSAGERTRRAGVSSFGISGTNAHVIVEEAPVEQAPVGGEGARARESPAVPFVLSGHTDAALRGQAERLGVWLVERPELELVDVAFTLATARARLERRAVVVGGDRGELLAGVGAVARGELAGGVVEGRALREGGRVVFVFPGQGAQWEGMALGLLDTVPVFADSMRACGEALAGYVGWSLEDVLRGIEGAPGLEQVDVVQPALFAVMVSLAALWRSFGVEPAAVVGHSQGEIAAAHVAGALSLEDAARVVCLRSRAVADVLAGRGGMGSVAVAPREAQARLERYGERLSLAAVNGPRSVVVSGEVEALEEFLAVCEGEGVWARRIPVDYPSHSALVEELRERIEGDLAGIEPARGSVPLYSTVTGQVIDAGTLDASYWYRNLRERVRFNEVVTTLVGEGVDAFVEVSPNPGLTVGIAAAAEAAGAQEGVAAIATLRRGEGGLARMLTALAEAYVHGVNVDWSPLFHQTGAHAVELPTYAFQRRRYWLDQGGSADPVAVGQLAGEHPLLGAAVRVAGAEGWLLTGRLSLVSQPWLADHAVGGVVLLPGAAFVELALAAAQRVGASGLDDLTLVAPLVLEGSAGVDVQVSIAEPDGEGRHPLNIYSARGGEEPQDGESRWTLHATGLLCAADAEVPQAPSPGVWPPAGAQAIDVEDFYQRLAEAGYRYGPAFQGLRAAWRDKDAWLAEIQLEESQRPRAGEYLVHPALLDAALHTILLAAADQNTAVTPEVPFAFAGVRLHTPGAGALRVRVEVGQDGEARAIELTAADEAGLPVLAVDQIEARPLDPTIFKATPKDQPLYEPSWIRLEPQDAPAPRVALVGAGDIPIEELEAELDRHPDLTSLERAVAGGAPSPEVVLVSASAGRGEPLEDAHAVTARVLELLQAWLACAALEGARLVILTDGALAVGDGESPNLAQAPVPGLVRSAASEHPLRFGLIDLCYDDAVAGDGEAHVGDGEADAGNGDAAAGLAAALASDESELALRGGAVFAQRLVRAGSAGTLLPPASGAWRLASERPGSLEDLALLRSDAGAVALGEGQIRLAVHAAGLNFRDVLVALGMRPGKGPLGSEAAGVVVEVGPGVETLGVGDRVLGFAADCMGSHAVTDARLLVGIPDGWSFVQAAALPTVFLTAAYGLVDIAALGRGERVLVHAGAGGVGMAAIQIARHLGAEVFATAHPDKWSTLEELGVERSHIASSRDLEFKDAFLAQTGGAGMDVVLDSLVGEFVDASLELLPQGGRFVEIGKADIREPQKVAAEHPGVRYRAFDLPEAGVDRLQTMFSEMVALFASGAYGHLPISTWDLRRGPDAFRYMREARHVGKIVLTVPPPPELLEGTVLITGGTGGLGALVARHLAAAHGAKRLLLTSRRGLEAEGAVELVAELGELGCRAEVVACDVADRARLESVLGGIGEEHPLVGVVHAAGVLDDATIAALDVARLHKVLAPKVDGALHLHELTKDRELSFFVLFSSAAAAIGSPGQGNYAAANAFLDALAHHRRAAGLAATALSWGAWERETGMVAEAERTRVSRMGVVPFSDEEGLSLLDTALAAAQPQLVPIRLDTGVLRHAASAGALPAILGGLVRAPARRGIGAKGVLARMLAQAPRAEWERIALELIRGHVAAVLGHSSPQAVAPDRNFKEMGFDSLAAVELRNRLIQATGLRLPATVVFDHPTPAAVAAYVVSKVAGAQRSRPAVARASPATDETIAIVGMSCRLPGGANSPAQLWELVVAGRDAIGEFPDDRGWDVERLFDPDPERQGCSYARHGGFVYDAGEFDAGFFAMGPREALATDPQQRLLLEATWEALEHAGIDPESLRKSDTGVFAGAVYQDYAFGGYGGSGELEGWIAVGSAGSVVSGRIAYALGFEGPAVTVDTACSSSLVAMHLACQSLRSGESSLAIAGGVTVLANPILFVAFSRQRGLSPDGRCRSFGAGADGVGFAEGAGLVVLERYSDARRLGHHVLAVVRGSAVNQDGASNGLAAPNGPSQERVIARALANAGLSPADVDVVEGHGTGTMLGDPIEAQALLETYGRERSNGPLYLGSVKSNIGHTQAAAGVAGVIKMVQALQHQQLPRSLHCEQRSPHVDWSAGQVELLHEPVAWPPGERPRRAGVSSFGISGTNAHLILEEPPREEVAVEVNGAAPAMNGAAPADGLAMPFVVSAADGEALVAQADRLASFLESAPEQGLPEVATALALRRAQLSHRACVVASDRGALIAELRALARGELGAGSARGLASNPGGVALLFSGQGSQWVGRGAGLYGGFPVFRAVLDEVCGVFDGLLGCSLLGVMFGESGSVDGCGVGLLGDTRFTQVALFALEVALFRLVESFGVRPDFLVGHSVGEFVAGYVAGVFSLADGCRLVAERARLMGGLPAGGAMLAVEASEVEVVESLEGFGGRVGLAAVNGPVAVTVSGEEGAVAELGGLWGGRGRRVRRLDVSHAFHSFLMEPMLAGFEAVVEGVVFSAPRIPIVSNVTGVQLTAQEACSAGYWVRHVREPVRFGDGVEFLVGAGVTRFLEVGPNRVLATLAAGSRAGECDGVVFASALRGAGVGEREALLGFLAAAHCGGVGVDWGALFDGRGVGRVELPTYAFQRRRYWLDPGVGSDPVGVGQLVGGHPLLGAAVRLAGGEGWLLTGRLSLASQPWLADHAVGGAVLLPGAAFVELALAAAQRVGAGGVEDLTLVAALVLEAGVGVNVQVSVGEPDGDGRRQVNIYSARQSTEDEGDAREDGEPRWTLHATGLLCAADAEQLQAPGLGVWPPAGAQAIDVEDFYEGLAEAGYRYGPAFQGLRAAWRDGDAWLADVELDETQQTRASEFLLHPALLDAALHTIVLAAIDQNTTDTLEVPFSFAGVRLHSPGANALRVQIRIQQDDDTSAFKLIATDQAGLPALTIDRFQTRPLDPTALKTTSKHQPLYRRTWIAIEPQVAPTPRVALVGESDILVEELEAELDRHPELASLERAVAGGAPPPEVVIAAAPAGRGELREDAHAVTAGVLELLQAWLASEALQDARLVVLTDGALAVRDGEQPNLAHAAVPGLVRSAAAEDPLRFALVDLGPGAAVGLGAALAGEEPELALRDGVLFAPRLARAAVGEQRSAVGEEPSAVGGERSAIEEERSAVEFEPEGTVLITGGTGGLGAVVARHLAAAHGVRRLVLTSRRGFEADGAAALAAELGELGCRADIVACDVTDRAQLQSLLAEVGEEHPLAGVVHAAGVLDDGTIGSLDGEQLRSVMAPKVDGALNLHELTVDRELSFFVLFSSAAAVLGSPGQGNYAAANAFLDGLAHHRHAHGLPAISVAWGPWRQAAGMVADVAAARMARFGIELFSDEQALTLLDVALAAPDPQLVAIRLDTGSLRRAAGAGALPPILSGVVRAPARRGIGAKGLLARMLAAAPRAEWERIALELIRGHVAAVLGHTSPQAVDPDSNFRDMGFDSLAAVELRNRLIQATGLRLAPTVVFDHPTPASVAAYIVGKVAGEQRARPALARAAAATEEPVAIVGMSCRYPGGVRSPEELWRLVVDGRDAIGEFPSDRGWDVERLFDPDPERRGSSYTRHGGFLYDAGEFDAGFFAMGPREALATDPQQRLLLEVAWEALEHAGIDPESLRKSDTGVFAGVMYQDYAFGGYGNSSDLEGWLAVGSAGSVVSGRIAYAFGFEGPAVTVDTACSSSLVTMHLACQALRSGESSLAIAGGVTVLANPMLFVEFSRQRGLSRDGRCKSFGADADGVGWGEGAGLVVLERLSDARRLRHPVLAVVRGSAVNQDGASNGLAAPNGPSQERVIERALANAGLSHADVDVVEGHGTGTALGDPIEAQALLETYGRERANGPLLLGSIKSNIGHTQAAAGVAGVIKMVQAMRYGLLPRSLHCEQPSPHVDWSAGQIELLRDAVQWPAGERPRRAGVSSFGISGTNAHVILEESPLQESPLQESLLQAPPPQEPPLEEPSPEEPAGPAPARDERPSEPRARVAVVPLLVSGRGEAGLRGQAARLRERLAAEPELDPQDVGYSLVTTRAQLEQRAVVLGSSREELITGLGALVEREPAAGVLTGEVRLGMTAFLFTGQGAQRPGMGAGLYATFPAFRAAFDEVCAGFDEHLGRPLKDVVFGDANQALEDTALAQPALFALEVALYRLLESHGVRAERLVGHSIGELAAAHAAGVLSLADACALVAARGRLMGALPAGGAMLAIEASEEELAAMLADRRDVSVAAVNGSRAVVVSGEDNAIADVEALWAERARKTSRLAVSHAFHSHLMEPMLDEFRAVAEGLRYEAPRIPIVSNLTGAEVSEQLCDPGYWVAHVRQPVRFADGVRELERLGVTRFVEIGPDAVLSALAQGSVSGELAGNGLFVSTLRNERDELRALLACLGALSASGAPVDWRGYFQRAGARRVELPTYAFQRERYWLAAANGGGDIAGAGLAHIDHPMLGAALPAAAADKWLFTGTWSLATHPWVADHAVFDTVLMPGTGFAELALRVAREVGCEAIEELTIEAPLLLAERGAVQVQVAVGEPGTGGRREIEIYSRPEGQDAEDSPAWTRHASGLLARAVEGPGDALAARLAGEAWPPPNAERIDTDDLYERLATSGYAYGPVFQGVTAAWRRGEEVFAEVSLDSDSARHAPAFGIHPALFDAAFHALLGLLCEDLEPGHVPLPFLWSGVRLLRPGAGALRVAVQPAGEDAVRLTALDENGAPTLLVDTVVARTIDVARMASAQDAGASSLFTVEFTEVPLAAANGEAPRFAVVGDVPGAPAGAERYGDLAELGVRLDAGAAAPNVVLAAVECGHAGEDACAVHDAVQRALALLQAWLASDALADARLALVTRGAVAARDGEVPELPAAAVWGLTRSAAAENPGRIVSVDLDVGGEIPWLPLLAADEPQLAVRAGGAYAPRLVCALPGSEAAQTGAPGGAAPATGGAPLTNGDAQLATSGAALAAEGTILVTGGTGGLGALIARHLAERGERHLLLASRRGPDAEGTGELVAQLAELGCEATLAACDFGDRDAVAGLLASIPDARPLSAVIHTAGVMEDGTIPSLGSDQVDRVLRPKVDGSLHLHELTKDIELSDFILFSSAAPLLGGAGQGNYAAANAALDALAQRRHAQGLPARALAWGLWGLASGMAGGAAAADLELVARAIRARLGLVPMPPDEGLELFERARALDAPLVVPAYLDSGVLRAQARAGALPAALRGVVRTVARRERAAGGAIAERLAGRPREEWDAVLLETVRAELAAVLGHESTAAIDPERNILELGLDSLGAVELRNRLARSVGVRIAPTVAFETPTAQGLATHLAERLHERTGAAGVGALGGGADVGAAEANGTVGTLTTLLHQAHEHGLLGEFLPMLVSASRFRATSPSPAASRSQAALDGLPPLVSFASGDGPELVCVPSFLAGSGPHQFARLAAGFGGGRGVSAFALPGFRPGERVPASWEAVVAALAEAVRARSPDGPFVLAGYSIGGALAHALARRLEEEGLPPAGLILIDTYAPEQQEAMAAVFGEVMGSVLDERHELIEAAVDDDNLVAMGTYARLMTEWEPLPIEAPSLLVRASQPLGDAYERGGLPWWQLPPDVVEVGGHHFDLIGAAAAHTAAAIDAWVRKQVGEPRPASR